MVQADREYYAIKVIGRGNEMKGFRKYNNTKDINEIINNVDKKQLSKLTTVFNISINNMKLIKER